MKKTVTRISVFIAVAVMFFICCFVSGCDNANNNSGRWNTSLFVAQNDAAKSIYNSIYNGISNNSNTLTLTSTQADTMSSDKDSTVGLSDILALLDNYYHTPNHSINSLINTYIGDIFSYSQIQLSLIEEYESEALVGTYNIDYSNVVWESENQTVKNLFPFLDSTKPLVAQFIGVDQDTNKAYIAQTHNLVGKVSKAKLEYYYDKETNEMGVTTLNWHYKMDTDEYIGFEYHYSDPVTNTVITLYGNLSEDYQLEVKDIIIYAEGCSFYSFNSEDEAIISEYVLSEIKRIEGKMNELEYQNTEIIENSKDFELPTEERSVIVNYDFSILEGMLKEV